MVASTQGLRTVNHILDETLSQGYAIFVFINIHHVADISKNFNKIFFNAPRFSSQLCHIGLGQPFKGPEAHFLHFVKWI